MQFHNAPMLSHQSQEESHLLLVLHPNSSYQSNISCVGQLYCSSLHRHQTKCWIAIRYILPFSKCLCTSDGLQVCNTYYLDNLVFEFHIIVAYMNELNRQRRIANRIPAVLILCHLLGLIWFTSN